MVSDERSEEFRRSVKESLTGPFQANRSDGIKPGIGIERKNKPTFRIVLTEKLTLTAVTMILIDDLSLIHI